jgi:hypothetical protein
MHRGRPGIADRDGAGAGVVRILGRGGGIGGQVDVGVANRFATPAIYGADVIIPTLAGIAVVRTS